MGLKARFTKGAAAPGAAPQSVEQRHEEPAGQEPGEEPSPELGEDLGEELDEELGDDVRSDIRSLADKKLRYKLGVRRELKHLPQVLAEGEAVLNLAAGRYDARQGLLVVTDRRLIFLEKGIGRSRQEDFPYSKLSSIQTSTGMMSGKFVIFVTGNKAIIDQILPKERVDEIGDHVRNRISDPSPAPAQGAPPIPVREDPEQRLRRLQRMLDDGLLSPEEFDERRRAILEDL